MEHQMEIISVIVMFVFGNMSDTETRLTQYIPMESMSKCLKEVRLLKRDKEFQKDAFCGPALVEINDDGEVITLHNEMPEGSTLSLDKKKVTKESMKKWTLKSKEKWESNK
jgi:hypothetical protein